MKEQENDEKKEKESLIKDENFVVIQGWMLNNLKLQGSELIVYATIWGFTQGQQDQWFDGTRQYLATWAGTSRVAIDKALKRLINKKLIEQKSKFINKVKYNCYRIISTSLAEDNNVPTSKESLQGDVNKVDTPPCKESLQGDVKKVYTPCKESLQGGVNKVDNPCKQSLHNNNIDIYIDNNIEDNIDNNIKKEKSKKEKPLISEEHESIISSYTENEHLKEKIKDFILDRKDRKKPVTVRALEMLLKKLTELAQTDDEKIAVINQSIECGYQGFFEVKGGYKNAGEGYYNSGITAYHGSGEKPKIPECYKRGLV